MLQYIAAPLVTVPMAGLAGWWWPKMRDEVSVRSALIGGSIYLIGAAVGLYSIGYQRFYRDGQKAYFYVVFVAPFVVASVLYVYGLWLVFWQR